MGDVQDNMLIFINLLIYFSANVVLSVCSHLGSLLRVQVTINPEKYLGLPFMVGR